MRKLASIIALCVIIPLTALAAAPAVIVVREQTNSTIEVVVPGPQGPAGFSELNHRGDWSVYTPYTAMDTVSYQGSRWIALITHIGIIPSEGAVWTLLAAKGDAGVGTAGPAGATGPQGPQGPPGVTVHNNLSSLQGGSAGEYYHLTNSQYSNIHNHTNKSALDLITNVGGQPYWNSLPWPGGGGGGGDMFKTTYDANGNGVVDTVDTIPTHLHPSSQINDFTAGVAATASVTANTAHRNDSTVHLTSAQKTDLTDGGDSTAHYHPADRNTDNHVSGTTNKVFTAAEQTKLSGIAAGATANSTDAQLRDRSTHTGSQATSTITGLDAALAGKEPGLGNPSNNGMMLSSTTGGTRSWVTIPGGGDMLKSVYDANGDGIVNQAASVPFSGVSSKPTTLVGYGITDGVKGVGTGKVTVSTSEPTGAVSGDVWIDSDELEGNYNFEVADSTIIKESELSSSLTSTSTTTAANSAAVKALNDGKQDKLTGISSVEINSTGSGDRNTYIDIHSDDTNADYSARLLRNGGNNGALYIFNAGLGATTFYNNGTASFQVSQYGPRLAKNTSTYSSDELIADSMNIQLLFTGTASSQYDYVGSAGHFRSTFNNASGKGTIHGLSSHAYMQANNTATSEITPLFTELISDVPSRMWGTDQHIHGPISNQANLIMGSSIVVNNYNSSAATYGTWGSVITSKPGVSSAGGRNSLSTYPIDVGLAFTGYSGAYGSFANPAFNTAIQIGGRAGGWMDTGDTSKIGSGIVFKDILTGQGIDLSQATIAGNAIKIGSSQMIGDGTNNYTIAQLREGVAGAYDATSWNGNNESPTKDAVRDKIEAMTGSFGEANTASNIGTGTGIFAQKSVAELQFKSLKAGANVTLSSDANEVTINALGSGGIGNVVAPASTGTLGYIPFWSGAAYTLNEDVGLFWDNTNKRLGLGLTTPENNFHAMSSGSSFIATLDSYGNTTSSNAQINFRTSRGTNVAPRRTLSGDRLFSIGGRGSYAADDSTDSVFESSNRASIWGYASEAATSTNQGAHLRFYTTPIASTTATEVARFTDSGALGIGVTNPTAKRLQSYISTTSGTNSLLSTTQTQPNTTDTNDTVLNVSHILSANSSSNELVIRSFNLSTLNNLTGGGSVENNRVINLVIGTSASTVTNIIDNIYLESSTKLGTVGTHHGIFIAPNALQGATSYGVFIDNQTNSGLSNLYGIGSNITSGTGRFNIYSQGSANNYFAGNVGIGTIAPESKLDINDASGGKLQLTYNDSDGSAANKVTLQVGSSGDLTITPSGGDVSLGSANLATTGTVSAANVPTIYTASVSNDFASLNPYTSGYFTYSSVTGAVLNDYCTVSTNATYSDGIILTCRVTANDQVRVLAYNTTGSAIDLASMTFNIRVTKY